MPAGELVDVLVMMVVVVMWTERVREPHQPAQGASELGVRMLEYPTVHARPSCGGAEVKMQREAVWLNMQSGKKTKKKQKQKKVKERRKKLRGRGGGEGGGGEKENPGRLPSTAATVRSGKWKHGGGGGARAIRGISRLRSNRDVNLALSLREPAH